jgi:hypothetical protein
MHHPTTQQQRSTTAIPTARSEAGVQGEVGEPVTLTNPKERSVRSVSEARDALRDESGASFFYMCSQSTQGAVSDIPLVTEPERRRGLLAGGRR